MTSAPRTPWWKRKRWMAAGVFWLVIDYLASEGPATYLNRRGWLPNSLMILFLPCDDVAMAAQFIGPYQKYVWWWGELGERHRLASN